NATSHLRATHSFPTRRSSDLSRNFAASMEIFADIAQRPMLPESALNRVRSERLMELLQQREEPAAIAGKRFSNLLYGRGTYGNRSEEHTSELQSRFELVCRLL